MKAVFFFLFLFVSDLLLADVAIAQPAKYSLSNGHAHNDYLNARPFYEAYENGLGSIEADVFPVNGKLCVAHSKKEIDTTRTLDRLYLQPIAREIGKGNARPFQLLVDIKENYKVVLPILIESLEAMQNQLSTPGQPKLLTIVITGNRPPPSSYKDYPSFIFFDDDLKLPHAPDEWNRVALVSLPFTRFSSWKGHGSMEKTDKMKIKQVIDTTHAAGKPIRFWAAPDNRRSWKQQKKLKADLIGTDKVTELAAWLD